MLSYSFLTCNSMNRNYAFSLVSMRFIMKILKQRKFLNCHSGIEISRMLSYQLGESPSISKAALAISGSRSK